jgi:hypothetical protein
VLSSRTLIQDRADPTKVQAVGPLTVPDGQTVDRFASALYDFLVSAGIDLTWSRALPLRLEAGLVDVAELILPQLAGVTEVAELLGVTRRRASALTMHPEAPAPVRAWRPSRSTCGTPGSGSLRSGSGAPAE